jgi:superfamily I DNA/RNA helicase
MALLLAAPENRIFLVGDDDQSIYGWRLADVRRCLASPGCPASAASTSS